jgi:hypothetical protein
MRVPSGNIRAPRQLTREEINQQARLDANYVCKWIIQADQLKTHEIPSNIVELSHRAVNGVR